PGELAYWSELQQVFHTIGFRMPPVVRIVYSLIVVLSILLFSFHILTSFTNFRFIHYIPK
ncbi:hypothetical protein ACT4UT_09200, partial [Bacillus sp. B-TM1]